MDMLNILIAAIRAIVGIFVFFLSGYLVALAAFNKKLDALEMTVYSIVFSLSVPTIILIFLNVFLKIPFNILSVYAVFVLVCLIAVAVYYYRFGGPTRKKKRKKK